MSIKMSIIVKQLGLCIVDPVARRTGSRYGKQYTDRFANLCYLMHVQLASVHFTLIVSLTLTLILKIYQNYP